MRWDQLASESVVMARGERHCCWFDAKCNSGLRLGGLEWIFSFFCIFTSAIIDDDVSISLVRAQTPRSMVFAHTIRVIRNLCHLPTEANTPKKA